MTTPERSRDSNLPTRILLMVVILVIVALMFQLKRVETLVHKIDERLFNVEMAR